MKNENDIPETAIESPKPLLVSAKKLTEYFDPPPSLKTVRKWTKGRQIPFLKVGGRYLYSPEKVVAYLEENYGVKPKR